MYYLVICTMFDCENLVKYGPNFLQSHSERKVFWKLILPTYYIFYALQQYKTLIGFYSLKVLPNTHNGHFYNKRDVGIISHFMNLSQKLQHTMMMYKGVHRACRPECFHSMYVISLISNINYLGSQMSGTTNAFLVYV